VGESLDERRDAHQRDTPTDHADQSRSAFRLITAPHVHPDAVALDAAVELAAVLVLLEKGLECVEEGHAALSKHPLLDHLVGLQDHRPRNRQTECFGGLQVDH
jgi:hypothetical protein